MKKNKLHICIISDVFPPEGGGIGYYAYNLSKRLISRGYKITIFTRSNWKKSYYEKIEGINVYRVQMLPVYPFHLRLHSLFLQKIFKEIEQDIDIVHYNSPFISFIKSRKPSIVTEHGTAKGAIMNSEITDIPTLIMRQFAWEIVDIDRKILQMSDSITAVSKACVDELYSLYNINPSRIVVVGNGVDSNFFVPVKKKSDISYILYVGRLNARKGLIDLINSAEYIYNHNNKFMTEFVIIGEGPILNRLKSLIRHKGLDKYFTFTGFVDRQKLLDYYQNAAIHVLPSYQEGLPTVVLEAMACGIPSVATNIPGTSELVVNNKTGILVEPKNPVMLASAILKILTDNELRNYLGSNAREYAKKYYDWNIITDRIENVYQELLKK